MYPSYRNQSINLNGNPLIDFNLMGTMALDGLKHVTVAFPQDYLIVLFLISFVTLATLFINLLHSPKDFFHITSESAESTATRTTKCKWCTG